MAFGAPSVIGMAQTRTAGTEVVVSLDDDVVAGTFVVVHSSWDNEGTADAETSQLSIADTKSQTWTLIREQTNSEGVNAADGVTTAAWWAVLGSAWDSAADSVTVTSTSSRTARCASVIIAPIDNPSVVVSQVSDSGLFSGGTRTRTIASLDDGVENLLLGFYACEVRFGDYYSGNTQTAGAFYTGRAVEDSDYTSLDPIGTESSSSQANVSQRASFRILAAGNGTTDDWTLSTLQNGDSIMFLAAFEESSTLPERFIAASSDLTLDGTANLVASEVFITAAGTLALAGVASGMIVEDATPRVLVWDGAAWV